MEEPREVNIPEQRKTSRLSVNINLNYVVASESGGLGLTCYAVTKNIGASGLLFENDKMIPIDSTLKMSLNLPGIPAKSFKVEGRVVRIEKLFPSLRFDIGINFLNLSDEDKEEFKRRIERMDIITLLDKINEKGISDLHLTANSPPIVRYFGKLKQLEKESLSAEQIKQMLYAILSDEQKKHFEEEKNLEFALSLSPASRYRVSIYQQRGMIEAVFRNIALDIKNRQELGLPDVVEDLCFAKDGIIIIAGTTGSGKTTTISVMMDIINKHRDVVILSLEQPIEYLHVNEKAIIKQREIKVDVPTFASGLKSALRQDPDIIIVGEVLDGETIETALQAAETGHLVITSLHATDSVQVFDRIASLFPPEYRSFIYSRLSHSLKAIVTQKLLPCKTEAGRVLATEVCVGNTAVRRIVSSGNFTELPAVIETGRDFKMQLMRQSVTSLYEKDLITSEVYQMHMPK